MYLIFDGHPDDCEPYLRTTKTSALALARRVARRSGYAAVYLDDRTGLSLIAEYEA